MALNIQNIAQFFVPRSWLGTPTEATDLQQRPNSTLAIFLGLYHRLTTPSASPAKANLALHRATAPSIHALPVASATDSGEYATTHSKAHTLNVNGREVLRNPTPFAEGGLSRVYHGFAREFGPVAVKISKLPEGRPEAESRRVLEERAKYEMQTMALLNQANVPGIPRIFGLSADHETGLPALVMEHIEGDNLADIILGNVERPLSTAQRLDVARQLLDIVAQAQSAGIAHGDLKCANVILTPSGRVYLTDWGSARWIHNSSAGKGVRSGGTIGYISADGIAGSVDAELRRNVYSLGQTLYELLGDGHTIHPADGRVAVSVTPLSEYNDRLSPKIDKIICERMLAFHANQRPSLEEVVEAFQPNAFVRAYRALTFRRAA